MTLITASAVTTLVSVLLVVACPLMMIFMMRGTHGGHAHAGGFSGDRARDEPKPKVREQMMLDELEAERDALNEEIGQRADLRVHVRR